MPELKRAAALRLGGGVMLAGCSSLPAFAQGAAVRMETTPVDSAAEPYYAYDGGFFKTAGIDVDLQNGAANGAAISAAIAAGALDVGVSNLVSVIQAHAKGIPFVVIGPGGLYTSRTPSTLLIVPNGSPVRGAADSTVRRSRSIRSAACRSTASPTGSTRTAGARRACTSPRSDRST